MKKRLAVLLPYSIALVLGATGGFVIKRFVMKPEKSIVGFNPDMCKPNGPELINKIEKEPTSDAAIKKYPAVDIANYALEKYKTCENSVSIGYGVASTIVDQQIRSGQIKVGDKYFEENVSQSSMVGVGKRMIQNGESGNTEVYNETGKSGVNINGYTAATNFKPNPDSYNQQEYKEAWGRNLQDMFIYCIHENTVIDQSIESITNGYKVRLKLNPDMGGYNYRFQMKTISNLDSLPIFKRIELSFTLDNSLILKHLFVDEEYSATMGVSVTIVNSIDYDYFPNLRWEIPALDENVDYTTLRGLIN